MDLLTFLGYVLFIEIDAILAVLIAALVRTWYLANQETKDFDHYDE